MGLFSLCVFISLLCFVVLAYGEEKISWREIPFDDIVTKAEYYTRKLSFPSKRRRRGGENHRFRHDAVVVTTKTNGRWLIEKGKKYSSGAYRDSNSYPYKDGNTIATPWQDKNTSGYRWTKLKSKDLRCRRTVLDFMKAAYLYDDYNVYSRNCQHAAKNMWKLAERRCSYSSYGEEKISWREIPFEISWREIPFDDIVMKAEYYTRKLAFSSKRSRRGENHRLRHDAVVVTTKTNGRWLIEKGKGFSSGSYRDSNSYPYKDGSTIATPWRDENRWTKLKSKELNCRKTVLDFMKAAYLYYDYDVIYRNCQHAAKNMWKLAEQRCFSDLETPSHGTHENKAYGKEKISWRDIPLDDMVTKAEYYTRKLAFSSKRRRRGENHRLQHDAVVVTTKTNGRWLIEKGKGYSSGAYRDSNSYPYKDGGTIATPWRDKNPIYKWTKLKSTELNCRKTVLDFMKAAYLYYDYDVIYRNCQHAAMNMWKLAEQRCSSDLEKSSYGTHENNAYGKEKIYGNERVSWREIPFDDTVTKAEYYTRKVASSSKRSRRGYNGMVRHDAVVVTTKTNGRWLIEKGGGYSSGAYRDSNSYPYKDGNTIATPWRGETLSEYRWTKLKSEELSCRWTVLDFMEAAFLYYYYNVIFPNCQHAAKSMWKLAEQRCSNTSETSSYGLNDKTSLFKDMYILLNLTQKICVRLVDQRHTLTPDNFKNYYRQLLCNVVLPLDLKNEPDVSMSIFRYYNRYYIKPS